MQQQPVRVQNPPPQHHLNGVHINGSAQMNGHHPVQQTQQQQVPIRTPVPPAPAPSSAQPAQVSAAPPPPPRKLILGLDLRGFFTGACQDTLKIYWSLPFLGFSFLNCYFTL